MLALGMNASQGQQLPPIQTVYENLVINGLVQNDKTFAFYSLIVTPDNYDGVSQLSIRVIPEQYSSDPDTFISLSNQYPNSSLNSDFYCSREGSDSCQVPANKLSFGSNVFIGIRCIEPCQYSLANNYLYPQQILSAANRTAFILNSYSSNIFSYFIPPTNTNGNTRAVIFLFESDSPYNPMNSFFSLDNQLYQINSRQVQNLFSTGVGFYFTENDFGWCTNCFVYLMLDVIIGAKYYATFTPTNRNPVLTPSFPTNVIVNAMQQECLQFYVTGTGNDFQVTSIQQEGDSDLYVSNGNIPTNILDTRVKASAQLSNLQTLVYSARDRNRTSLRTGLAQVCLFGRQDSSALITGVETNNNGRFDAQNNMLFTMNFESNSSNFFRFTQQGMLYPGLITVQVASYNLSSGQAPPRIFYKICTSNQLSNCFLTAQEQRGNSSSMIEIGSGNGNVSQGFIRTALLNHNPAYCSDPSSCIYLITVFFRDVNGPMRTTFLTNFTTNYVGVASLDTLYQNILQQGQYFYYQLSPKVTKGLDQLQALTVKVISLTGDADLVVSVKDPVPIMNTGNYESIQTDIYESITINTTGNFSLNRTIIIGVFAYTSVAYQLIFEPVYVLNYNVKLIPAVPMLDSIAKYNYFVQEYEESFYSFTPWWAGFEQRTLVSFADVIFNDVFFYMVPNDFPMFYLTEYQDQNDIIALDASSPDYSISNTYYIRVRPQFQLEDLFSLQQYIFNFFVFSMHIPSQIADVPLNSLLLGYANKTNAFYRHFILDNTGTYNFTVIPIIGNPALLLKISDQDVYPQSLDVQSWDYKSDNPDEEVETIISTFDARSGKSNSCLNAGYNLNGGNRSCGLYIGVECQDACVYNISVTIQGREDQQLPNYITEEMYVNGQVKYGQYKYFYYPINQNTTGEMVLILNKTGSKKVNGDSMLLALILNSTAGLSVQNWQYPTLRQYTIASTNFINDRPEIIEMCDRVIQSKCSNSSCVLMVGILGLSPNRTSNFRLLVQKQQNKMYDRTPINGLIVNQGDYDYYWFVSNLSTTNASAIWSYTLSLGLAQDGQDADLFVSVIDGRFPVDSDFDFSSSMLGPDNLVISSTDQFWNISGYNKSDGVLFIVGIKAITPNVSYTLLMQGPTRQVYFPLNLTTGVQVSRGLNGNSLNNRTHYYKWFNWGFKDFRFDISIPQGAVNVYFNFMSEETFAANGFTNFPSNANNSVWSLQLNQTQSGLLRVTKYNIGGTGFFCYFCWYFITIDSNTTGINTYQLTINQMPDIGEEVPILSLNQNSSLTLPATGAVTQRKFILDSTDSFMIRGFVNTGFLIMYVGLYPDNAVSRYQWMVQGSGAISISVKQTDLNFHVGAFYYITCQASSGRTAFSLQVIQNKKARPLYSGEIYKDQFWTMQDRIKNYYFQAPSIQGQPFKATFNIISLQNGFYPLLLVRKLNFTSTPSSFIGMQYPTMINYNHSFGDNFYQTANQNSFQYVLRETGGNFTYFTISLYSFTYGITDKRKPEFKIQLILDTKNLNDEAASIGQYSMPEKQSYQEVADKQLTKKWLANKLSFQRELNQ